MVTEHRASDGPSIRSFINPERLTPEVMADIREQAGSWISKGVILSIDWDSYDMVATNQLGVFSFRISELSQEAYGLNWEKTLGISFRSFCGSLLAAIVCFLGRWALPSLQGLVRDAQKFIHTAPEDFKDWIDGGGLEQPHLFHDLLLLLPQPDGRESAIDSLTDIIDCSEFHYTSLRRDLPDVKSFLVFGTILERFMASGPTPEALSLYYPVYLWWRLSGIMPLRPIEFLVIPYECIRQDVSGTWHLTLRRSAIKGTGRMKAYNIKEDFEQIEYEIPAAVAELIQGYREHGASQGQSPCGLGTLLMPGLHYSGLGWKRPESSRYYTYANFNHALQRFQDEVIHEKYGYAIIQERSPSGSPAPDRSIYRILPGDTRHMSLFNAAKTGVQPQTLMELVRHSDINQTFWYAANEKAFRWCAASIAYEEDRQRHAPIPTIPLAGYFRIRDGSPFLKMEGGRCYSPHLNAPEDPDARDCIQSTGPRGELGWCSSCPYFRRDGTDGTFDPSRLALDAQSDWELLLQTIEHYRKDILQAGSLIASFEKARTSINILLDLVKRDALACEEEG